MRAKKSLSQNFIYDKNICNKIVKVSNLKNKFIIEIGPGYGFLTDFIIKENPKKVILIEKDYKIYEYLLRKYNNNKNIEIINKDVLDLKFDKFNDVIVISNLPYNVSTKIILNLFKFKSNIKEMIFMIQKEVAIKFDYKIPKLNKYKFFTILSSNYNRCFDVPPTVFKPKPKVISSIVSFTLNKQKINWENAELFSNLIFKNKRKVISSKINLKNIGNFGKKRIDELNIKELLTIYNFF